MTGRLTSLTVANFRSIRGRLDLDLDAPIILIHGANGSGKTSLLSALQLALTGTTTPQNGFQKDPCDLVHVGAEEATISVRCDLLEGKSQKSEITIRDGTISGEPLLTTSQARFFNERCFLAQSILGRLLEIYEGEDVRNTSPLTRFVQEHLGLDVFDNIIEGLHHVRDIRRLRKALPAYKELEDLESEREANVAELERLQTRATADRELAEVAANDALSELQEPDRFAVASASIAGAATPEWEQSKETERLASLRHEISGAKSLWEDISKTIEAGQVNAAEAALAKANAEYEGWASTERASLISPLDSARSILRGLSNSATVGFEEAHLEATRAIEDQLRRRITQAKEDDESKNRLRATRITLRRSEARIRGLDERLASVSHDSGDLVTALSALVQHVDDDICPVCERDFSETSDIPLRAHLIAHVSSLSQTAEELQKIIVERQSATQTMEREQILVIDLERRVLDEEAAERLKNEIVLLSEVSSQLQATKDAAKRGTVLQERVDEASVKLSELHSEARAMISLREATAEFAHELDVGVGPESESISDWLGRCIVAVDQRIERIGILRSLRQRAWNASTALAKKRSEESQHAKALDDAITALERVSSVRTGVDQILEDARCLVGEAINARTNLVRRVFNDSLNEVWRDLFVRLAPDEGFIPEFDVPEGGKGPIRATLNTLYQGTQKTGNPRSVLSYGNLNTAALTLFLSLHLSVHPKLPWLVVDDPVQSMDEIHIAQLAVLLRTLSRQCCRQVIIAVHERALFDYLSLELTPAFEGDRLVTIELGKAYAGNTPCAFKMKTWDPAFVLDVSDAV